MPDDDVTLLRRYARDRSEDAFTALVRRRIGLVYSCALRRVGYDAQLAEDVTQVVFSALARKAGDLCERPSLLGWFHVSAGHAAAEIVRKEQRRKTRETQAAAMETLVHSSPPAQEVDWSRLRPVLDELIGELKDLDREALMLRFFEQRPFAEIAATLSLTEEGARKRVERATERIRAQLARRGVTSGTSALAFALGEQAAAAVPAALAGNVAAMALVETGAAIAGTSMLATAAGALAAKAALVVATLLAGAGLITWQLRANAALEAELARAKRPDTEIRALQEDNQRLARRIAEASDLRRDQAIAAVARPPAPPPARAEAPKVVSVVITAQGTIQWENQRVTLQDFIERLTALQARSGDHRPQVVVQGAPGSTFDASAYAVEQASKAGIADIAIATAATPPPTANWLTTTVAAPGAGEREPPSVPDPVVAP